MVNRNLIIMSLVSLLGFSCSTSEQSANGPAFSTASEGMVKKPEIDFPLYLTSKIENRTEIVAKTSADVFIVHTGHLLNPLYSKEQNEELLTSLKDKGIDLVNLTLEDFIIASNQEINFENYPQKFLNSSVMDLQLDSFITLKNVTPFFAHGNVVFVGISDKNIDPSLSLDKFLVSDYVLSVLRARKLALGGGKNSLLAPRAFVIVQNIGAEINDVMDRLPPNFINSLAN